MTMTLSRMQSSELSRNPKSVFVAAEREPVVVTRRDGEDLVLMTERESDSISNLLEYAADFFVALSSVPGSVTEKLSDRFHWMLALDETARDLCAKELLEAMRVALVSKRLEPIYIKLNAWRDTALAYSDKSALAEVEWLSEPIRITRP
jgi:hypothetical protein